MKLFRLLVPAVMIGTVFVPAATASAQTHRTISKSGCTYNAWSWASSQQTAIAGSQSPIPSGCGTICAANRYNSGGTVYRTAYTCDSTPASGSYAAYSSPGIPSGTSWVGGQYKVCTSGGSCSEYTLAGG